MYTSADHWYTAGGVDYRVAIIGHVDEFGAHYRAETYTTSGKRVGWQAGYRTAEQALAQARTWLDVATRFNWLG